MAYPQTSIGNQFPSPGYIDNVDLHAAIDTPLDAVAALVNAGPYGSVGHNTLASGVTGITNTGANVATVTVSVVAGRKYRVTGYAEGTQVTTTGNAVIQLTIAAGHAEYYYFKSAGAGETIFGDGSYLYIPGSSASVTFTVQVSTSAGTASISAGAFILVEDIGTT